MLWSVQWCIGLNETTWGSLSLAEAELGLGLGAVAGDDLGDGPVVVVGDQDVFAEDLVFQRGAGVPGRCSRSGAGPGAGRRSAAR